MMVKQARRRKDKAWFRGLLYAESIGRKEALIQFYQHEFDDDLVDFERGVLDYIRHSERLDA